MSPSGNGGALRPEGTEIVAALEGSNTEAIEANDTDNCCSDKGGALRPEGTENLAGIWTEKTG
jgi:hypothetical protein